MIEGMADCSFTWIVSLDEADITLQHFIRKRLGDQYSLKQIKKCLENNSCEVNGRKERFASIRLAPFDQIVFHGVNQQLPDSSVPDFDKKRVLYVDDAVLIYDKPPGVVCEEKGIVSLLKKAYPSLFLVHRLDKDTSGALVFARSKMAYDSLLRLFRERAVSKEYLAFVDRIPSTKKGNIEFPMAKLHDFSGKTLWGVDLKGKHGMKALTGWELLESGNGFALLLCKPLTGRTHQIRVHLNAIGHPILGDTLYGKCYSCTFVPKRLMLHAWKLSFPHPLKPGKIIQVMAPIPEDMIEIKKLCKR